MHSNSCRPTSFFFNFFVVFYYYMWNRREGGKSQPLKEWHSHGTRHELVKNQLVQDSGRFGFQWTLNFIICSLSYISMLNDTPTSVQTVDHCRNKNLKPNTRAEGSVIFWVQTTPLFMDNTLPTLSESLLFTLTLLWLWSIKVYIYGVSTGTGLRTWFPLFNSLITE